jgi:hypothetical protein
MSTGERLPIERAEAAAGAIFRMWGLSEPYYQVVGSIRRRRPTVGDIEIIGPAQPEGESAGLFSGGACDTLHDAIAASVAKGRVEVVRGLKPHFLACSLLVKLKDTQAGTLLRFPLDVFRYAADGSNRGWIELMRTGPSELGILFLARWKFVHGISPEGKASIDGHLVDALGNRIATPDELTCWEKCDLRYVEPERRDEYTEAWKRREMTSRREVLR